MEIGKKVYPEKIIWLFLRNAYIQIKKMFKKKEKNGDYITIVILRAIKK